MIEEQLNTALTRGKSVLLLGARQTGKTTLINKLKSDLQLSLVQPNVRQHYEKDPGALIGEVEALHFDKKNRTPLVIIDEVQKVPEILDAVQDLIDRQVAQFVLTGSSARKLRTSSKINLLPGRVVALQLDPLALLEQKPTLPALEEPLLYGSLPGIVSQKNNTDKEIDLNSYVTTYIEEEIRAEALVRNLGTFSRFLELAASESGNIVSFNKLSQEIGVAHTTISSYYQILEDCLIVERVEPLVKTKTRRRLIKSKKYLFFDLGIRRLSAIEGIRLPTKHMGHLFEQFIGLELIRCAKFLVERTKIHFWRDANGPEVDWVIQKSNEYVPIETKWTTSPTKEDTKHLNLFLNEYDNADVGYVVCRCPRKTKLTDNIYAIPWQEIDSLIYP